MLSKYLVNKIVTLHCKPDSGLGVAKGIISEVSLDEGFRAFLVLPEKEGRQLIIYADQVSYFVVHGTVEEMTQRLEEAQQEEEEEEQEQETTVSGSVEDIIGAAEEEGLEDIDVDDLVDDEEETARLPRGMPDMNAPELLSSLQGQSTGYGGTLPRHLAKLLAKMQKETQKNETKQNTEGPVDSEEGSTKE